MAALMILLGTGKDTIRLSTTIADIARAEGKEWHFWKDRRQLYRFACLPQEPIKSSDARLEAPSAQSPNRELIPYL